MKLVNNFIAAAVLLLVPSLCIAQHQSSSIEEYHIDLYNSELVLDRTEYSKLVPLDSLHATALKFPSFMQFKTPRVAPQVQIPVIRDFSSEGLMWGGDFGAIVGMSSMTTNYGMGSSIASEMLYVLNINNRWTFSLGVYASKYALMNIQGDNFGISGSAHYSINNNFRLNFFGAYYTHGLINNHAIAPFFRTSYYGGSLSIEGRSVGIDLGAQNVYNALSGQWEVVPIFMPKVKLGNANAWICVDLGGVIKNAVK